MGLLDFIFSSFWVFIGIIILIHVFGRVMALLVIGLVAALRGTPVQTGSGVSRSDAISAVHDVIAKGGMDAAIARANARNAQRRRV